MGSRKGVSEGDTRSLDYSSYNREDVREVVGPHFLGLGVCKVMQQDALAVSVKGGGHPKAATRYLLVEPFYSKFLQFFKPRVLKSSK